MENENINISLSKITAESISQQAERWRKAHADASAAAGAYMADLEQRKAELSKLEARYKSQLKNLNAQRKVLAARVTDLSSRGKIDKAAEEDERLEATDKAISTLERKLRLVNETELKGDPHLYEAAKAAYKAVEPAKLLASKQTQARCRELTFT